MIFSYVLTLLGVCGLAVGSLVILRAAKGGGLSLSGVQPIRIIGRQSVGTGSTLMLVEVEGERLMIGVSRGGIAVLERYAPQKEPLGLSLSKPCPSFDLRKERTTLRQAQGERFGGSFRTTLHRAGERW